MPTNTEHCVDEMLDQPEGVKPALESAIVAIKERYELDFRWRETWIRLSTHRGRARARLRTQRQQEAIERKARLANNRIRVLMRRFDEIREHTV